MNPVGRTWVIGGALVALAGAIAAVILVPLNGGDLATSETPGSVILAVSFVSMGALLALRRPEHAIGWIFLIAGFFNSTNALSAEFPDAAASYGWPGAEIFAWLATWSWAGGAAGFPLILLLFPTGRPPGPRWGWVLWLTGVAVTLIMVPMGIAAWPKRAALVADLDIDVVGGVANFLQTPVGTMGLGLALVASVVSLIVRFRQSVNEERQQLKWLVFAGLMTFAILITISPAAPIDVTLPDAVEGFAALVALPSIPAAAAIAILRYRLYDIDLVINRTLVYGLLTAALLASYLLIVVTLSRVLDPLTRDSDVAIAASTLAVAALFRPLRGRIQAFIDRRFYRAKYDSAQALAAFGSRLRDTIEVETVADDVLSVIGHTVQPSHASLWLRADTGAGR